MVFLVANNTAGRDGGSQGVGGDGGVEGGR